MTAINRVNSSAKFESRSQILKANIKCVFISHQKSDRAEAKKIADFLLGLDIDVYFDEYDKNLKFQYQDTNPKLVTKAILDGINNSSHMLVLVSPNTLTSRWVPFEIGYGYDKTDVKALCLAGIPKGGLPEYLRSVDIIRDIDDLNNISAFLSGKSKQVLIETRALTDYSNSSHPLAGVMDRVIDDSSY